jgi:riboflavin biosynthesis pyrimidine reductase
LWSTATRRSLARGEEWVWTAAIVRLAHTRRPSSWSCIALNPARNSKIIGPYDPDAIRSLKDEVEGDLYVSGSGTLVRAMLADGLVDELHLFVYPLTRGSGPRLFPEEAAAGKLALAACESYENGVVSLACRPQP